MWDLWYFKPSRRTSRDLSHYLKADPKTLLERIKHRNRASELSISIEYLSFLNDLYDDYIYKNCTFKVLTVQAFHQNDLNKYTLDVLEMIYNQVKTTSLGRELMS